MLARPARPTGPAHGMRSVEEHERMVGDVGVRWLSAPGPDPPVLYVHGVPTGGEDWRPFLERTGGIAPDLPGFGRSHKPTTFDYSIPGYARFLETFLDELGVERVRLVVHDWGAVGLALAQRAPERVERLVVMSAVPFLPGYRWHRVARWWRRPVLGELVMGATTRWSLRQLARRGSPPPFPPDLVDRAWRDFDQGTQRAILRLYRSAPPEVLAEAGERLGAITVPALVLWGDRDPYLPVRFAQAYAAALPRARSEVVEGAGHWPWLDRPEVVDSVVRHLED